MSFSQSSQPVYLRTSSGEYLQVPADVVNNLSRSSSSSLVQPEYGLGYGWIPNSSYPAANVTSRNVSPVYPPDYLPIKHIHKRVPCGFSTSGTPAKDTYTYVCNNTSGECQWSRQHAPGSQTVKELDCDKDEVRAIRGYQINKSTDYLGNTQNIVTPEVAVETRLGPPHPGKSITVEKSKKMLEEEALEDEEEEEEKEKKPKKRKSPKKKRKGGAFGDLDEPYITFAPPPSTTIISSSSTPAFTDYYLNPGPENAFYMQSQSQYGVSNADRFVLSGFPFTFRCRPVSFLDSPRLNYWNWLRTLNDRMKITYGPRENLSTLYFHDASPTLDTIGTLESYILAGIVRIVDANRVFNVQNAFGSINAAGNLRSLMSPEMSMIAVPVEFNRFGLPFWRDVRLYRIVEIYREPKDAAMVETRDLLLTLFTWLQTQSKAKYGDSFETRTLTAPDSQIQAVIDAELLALFGRIQFVRRAVINLKNKDITAAGVFNKLSERSQLNKLSQELRFYLETMQFEAEQPLFIDLPSNPTTTPFPFSNYSTGVTTTIIPSSSGSFGSYGSYPLSFNPRSSNPGFYNPSTTSSSTIITPPKIERSNIVIRS